MSERLMGSRSARHRNRAYFSLGSNIEAERNLPAAVDALAEFGRLRSVSSVWESAAVGVTPGDTSPNFLNGAVLLETEEPALALCTEIVPALERRLNRVRNPRDKNAPRTIDLDLSLFNDDVLQVGHRTIPDPAILRRAFVAVPLAEVAPDYFHPVAKRRLSEIAAALAAAQPLMRREDVCLQSASRRTNGG